MTTLSFTVRPGQRSCPVWRAYHGKEVRLYAHSEGVHAQCAPSTLREADGMVTALKKLLAPEPNQTGSSVEVYLVDAGASLPELNFKPTIAGGGTPLAVTDDRDRNAPAILVRTVSSKTSSEPVAQSLTRLLIGRWFGSNALGASIIVTGIAGLAAAQAKVGPSAAEADQWVREEIEAKRLPLLEQLRNRADGQNGLAAASFVAFLLRQGGVGKLRKYLAAYDPAAPDHAAYRAYKQPLAVLEESWRQGLRRRTDREQALRSLLPQLLEELKPYRAKQIEILFYLLLAAALSVVPALLVGRIVGVLKAAAGSGAVGIPAAFPGLLLGLLGSLVLSVLVSLRRSYATAWLGQHVLSHLQERMYGHLLSLGVGFYSQAKVGDLMERLQGDLQSVQQALAQLSNKGLYQLLKLTATSIALIAVASRAPQLTLPLLLLAPLFYVCYAALRTRNKQAGREQRGRAAETSSVVQESLCAQEVIQAFGLQKRARRIFHARMKTQRKSALRLAFLSSVSDLSEDAVNGLALLFVYGMGGLLLLRVHTIGLGTIVTLAALLNNLLGPIASLAGMGQNLQQAAGAMERVQEILQTPVTLTDRPEAMPLSPLAHALQLQNVSFSYEGKRPILQDLNVSIPAGAHVAVVGRSGSGKSTLARLLLRFYDPSEGSICWDGADLKDLKLASLRQQIGPVFQETFIFNTTLMENIRLSRPEATDEEVIQAARKAQLHADVLQFPAGYHTLLGERGGRLSGGQKQRLAIARVFLRDPSVLLLDEATSALDPQTEAGVMETLSKLVQGRTTISIAHRLSWAAKADWVVVLEAGRMVEQGTHAELVKAGGLYSELWKEYTS